MPDSPEEFNKLTRRTVLGTIGAAALAPKIALAGIQQPDRPDLLPFIEGTARLAASLTALRDGRLLLVGGVGITSQKSLSTAEIIDPATGESFSASPMSGGRARHAAVLLPDGRVAVLGGYDTAPLDSVEFYDPMTDTWSDGKPLGTPRMDHSAAIVGDDIFITGGRGERFITGAEAYRVARLRGRA